MTWTRLDDTWTDLPELADLPHAERWHYLCMIQFCSRTLRYDGVLKVADARRCSDLDDPDIALDHLAAVGLVVRQADGRVKVVRIDEHIPPPSVRENAERSKVRMQRMRAHKNGDHSLCLPDKCEHVAVDQTTGEVTTTDAPVTAPVTRNTGTGQDGTGQALSRGKGSNETVTRNRTSSSPEPCFSCGQRPAVNGSDCLECSSPAHRNADRIASPPDRPATAHRAPTVPSTIVDDRPACTDCNRRMGKQEAAVGKCFQCQRIAAATDAARRSA